MIPRAICRPRAEGEGLSDECEARRPHGQTHVTEYDEGTIITDIADAREKELVWLGVGTGRMQNTQRKPDEMTQHIYEVVDDIPSDFPPGAAAE